MCMQRPPPQGALGRRPPSAAAAIPELIMALRAALLDAAWAREFDQLSMQAGPASRGARFDDLEQFYRPPPPGAVAASARGA